MNAENVSVSSVVKKGYSLYLRMLPILVALGIFAAIISSVIIYYEVTVVEPSKTGLSVLKFVEAIVAWIVGLSLYAALFRGYYNQNPTIGDALTVGLKKFFPSIGAMIVTGVILLAPPAVMVVIYILMTGGFSQLSIPGMQSSTSNSHQITQFEASDQHMLFSMDLQQPQLVRTNAVGNTAAQASGQALTPEQMQGQEKALGDVAANINQSMGKMTNLIIFSSVVFILWLLYFGTRLALVLPLVVNQNKGVISSVKESFQLTKGRFWKTLGVFLCAALPYMIVVFIVSTICAIVFSTEQKELAVSIALIAIQLVLAPMIPANITVYLESLQPSTPK